MQKNIIIDFIPKCSYKDWVFNEIVTVKKNNLDFFSKEQIVEEVNNILSKIPDKLLEATILAGWKIVVTNQRNLEEECGAPAQIYGYTNFNKKEIVVYATKEGIEFSLPHELAHFFDVLTDISISKEWQSIYNHEKDTYLTMKYTFTTPKYKSECFADAFMFYITNKEKCKKSIPKTYIVIDNIFKYINYILDEDCIKKYKEKQANEIKENSNEAIEISCFSEYNWN